MNEDPGKIIPLSGKEWQQEKTDKAFTEAIPELARLTAIEKELKAEIIKLEDEYEKAQDAGVGISQALSRLENAQKKQRDLEIEFQKFDKIAA